MREFVNPMGLPIRGDVMEFDFLYFKVGNDDEMCANESLNDPIESELFGEEFGADSMCAMSTLSLDVATEPLPRCFKMFCAEGPVLTIQIGNESQVCFGEGDELLFSQYQGSVTCPNPNFICGMKSFLQLASPWNLSEYFEEDVPDDGVRPAQTWPPKSPVEIGVSMWKIVGILVGVVLLGVVCVGLWCLWQENSNNRSDNGGRTPRVAPPERRTKT
jgi:hypothetical protein